MTGNHTRYQLRHDPDDTWAVEDIFTGQTAEVNGIPQGGLNLKMPDARIDLLNL
ncbi:hypothetical protein [Rhizobium sp. Leaf371]|uniref:hypothetical protein n=1 Tax=Rhizobium sp. Leaf371 TaxID=1736355 RepID=UPI000A5CF281|nr:hypothetical protein [Rhizobium sp. Leaf371]